LQVTNQQFQQTQQQLQQAQQAAADAQQKANAVADSAAPKDAVDKLNSEYADVRTTLTNNALPSRSSRSASPASKKLSAVFAGPGYARTW